MFNFVGEQAVDGALGKIDGWLKGLTPEQMKSYFGNLPVVSQFSSMFGDVEAGYSSLTPEQRASFWAAVIVMATKIMASA